MIPVKIQDSLGNDVNPNGPAPIGGALQLIQANSQGQLVITSLTNSQNEYAALGDYKQYYNSLVDWSSGRALWSYNINNPDIRQANKGSANVTSSQTLLGVVSVSADFHGPTNRLRRTVLIASSVIIASALASINATVISTAAYTKLGRASGYNASASVRYLKIYDKVTAPVPATDVPIMIIPLAPTSTFNFDLSGFVTSNGASFIITTGPENTNTGALTAADVVGLTITYGAG